MSGSTSRIVLGVELSTQWSAEGIKEERGPPLRSSEAPIGWLRWPRRLRDQLKVRCLRRGDVLTVPPAATQRLKQGRGVGVARGLRLHQSEQRRVIGVLGRQKTQIADGAELQLAATISRLLKAARSAA